MDADRISRHLGHIDFVHGDHRGHQYLIRETGTRKTARGVIMPGRGAGCRVSSRLIQEIFSLI
jgi:hypothetical protein